MKDLERKTSKKLQNKFANDEKREFNGRFPKNIQKIAETISKEISDTIPHEASRGNSDDFFTRIPQEFTRGNSYQIGKFLKNFSKKILEKYVGGFLNKLWDGQIPK